MRLRIIIASSVVLLCGAAEQKLAELGDITQGYTSQLDAFAKVLDSSKLQGVDENEFFKQVQFPLMKALPKALKPFGHPGLYTGTGPYSEVSMFVFKVDRNTRQAEGLIVVSTGGASGKKTFAIALDQLAPITGPARYDQIFMETGISMAQEKFGIHVPRASMRFIGVFDDPRRSVGSHTISMAYVGATYDEPIPIMKNQTIKIMTDAEVQTTKRNQWITTDGRAMALQAHKIFSENSAIILAGLGEPTSDPESFIAAKQHLSGFARSLQKLARIVPG